MRGFGSLHEVEYPKRAVVKQGNWALLIGAISRLLVTGLYRPADDHALLCEDMGLPASGGHCAG